MAPHQGTAFQRETAERNAEAILDAAEELISRQGHASISAVAAEAGVSRVTVYAHFPTSEALLEATVERAVRQTVTVLHATRPDEGPAAEALDRMLAAAWRHLGRYQAMAAVVSELMSPSWIARTHQAAQAAIGELVARGQAERSFRTDMPAGWLTAACIALVHTCFDEVRNGRIDEGDAVHVLTTSVRDLFTGRR